MNKWLWTPSFVLVTAAISIGLIALAHLSVDRSRVASAVTFPPIALGRNALLVYVGQHAVGVWISRAHVGSVTASTWLIEHGAQRWVQPPGAGTFCMHSGCSQPGRCSPACCTLDAGT